MARLIIEARKHSNKINAGINFKCDSQIISFVKQYAMQHNLNLGGLIVQKSRMKPLKLMEIDTWKVDYLVKKNRIVPDLFYEGDGWGKEPLFFLLGINAVAVVKTAIDIAKGYRKQLIAER